MPGVKTGDTYTPKEIRAYTGEFPSLPVTIESGQNLDIGTVIGIRPTSNKSIAYDKDADAAATAATAGSNTGGGTCSSIAVQNAYTLTETWTLTCTTAGGTGVGKFSVVGSVSGSVGEATVGTEFKYPNTAAYMAKFTISDGAPDFAEDDTFTFSTTAAGAKIAKGILIEDVDATSGDVLSAQYIGGKLVESLLIGLDDNAKMNLVGRTVGDVFIF